MQVKSALGLEESAREGDKYNYMAEERVTVYDGRTSPAPADTSLSLPTKRPHIRRTPSAPPEGGTSDRAAPVAARTSLSRHSVRLSIPGVPRLVQDGVAPATLPPRPDAPPPDSTLRRRPRSRLLPLSQSSLPSCPSLRPRHRRPLDLARELLRGLDTQVASEMPETEVVVQLR